MAFLTRLRLWWWQYLISRDQAWLVNITFLTFVLFGRGSPPRADETISSRVGRNALLRRRWAILCEHFIDWLFSAIEPDHCLNSIEWDELSPELQTKLRALL